MEVQQKVGLRIKELREMQGVSQTDLSYLSDLDRTYIVSVENGHRNISIKNIEKICLALNVTLKDFFQDGKFDYPTTGS